jgi:hypothetical protein
MRLSLVPTKSVDVNVNPHRFNKYLVWIAKILFYICILNIVTQLITKYSETFGINLNYVAVALVLAFFAYKGQMHKLLL